MPNYKEMYLKMLQASEQAVNMLIEAGHPSFSPYLRRGSIPHHSIKTSADPIKSRHFILERERGIGWSYIRPRSASPCFFTGAQATLLFLRTCAGVRFHHLSQKKEPGLSGRVLFLERERGIGWSYIRPRSASPCFFTGAQATLLFLRTCAGVRFHHLSQKKNPAYSAGFLFLERERGIEPPSSAWEADVLPLNHFRMCIILS